MEVPLTQPCPDCGAEMEPSGRARRGQTVYTCPECGFEMEAHDDLEPDEDEGMNEEEEDEEDEDEDEKSEDDAG